MDLVCQQRGDGAICPRFRGHSKGWEGEMGGSGGGGETATRRIIAHKFAGDNSMTRTTYVRLYVEEAVSKKN